MSLRNTTARWGTVARSLHWLIATLIITLFILGEVMGDMAGGPDKFVAYALHKSFGLLALALLLARILWRLADKAPLPPAGVPAYQLKLASFVHWGLYGLMLAVPLSGWLVHSLAGYTTHWFGQAGWAVLPVLTTAASNRELVQGVGEVHGLLAWALVLTAAAHASAALYHHFICKDAVLARMTPFIKERS
jgi:cytochrome b561